MYNTRDCLSRKTLTAYEMYPTSILKPSVIYFLYFDIEMLTFPVSLRNGYLFWTELYTKKGGTHSGSNISINVNC